MLVGKGISQSCGIHLYLKQSWMDGNWHLFHLVVFLTWEVAFSLASLRILYPITANLGRTSSEINFIMHKKPEDDKMIIDQMYIYFSTTVSSIHYHRVRTAYPAYPDRTSLSAYPAFPDRTLLLQT